MICRGLQSLLRLQSCLKRITFVLDKVFLFYTLYRYGIISNCAVDVAHYAHFTQLTETETERMKQF